jgi:hypothetical protein
MIVQHVEDNLDTVTMVPTAPQNGTKNGTPLTINFMTQQCFQCQNGIATIFAIFA